MNYSHVEKNLKLLINYHRINGLEVTEQDKTFFTNILKMAFGDGYQKAADLAADVVYKDKFQLSVENFEWFMKIHRKHMRAFGTENQKKYSLPNVRDVKYDKREDCLKVYYDDTWWHYDRRGEWY